MSILNSATRFKTFMKHLVLFLFILSALTANAQQGIIKGKIYNKLNKEAVPFATIVIEGTTLATTSDENGNFSFNNVKPGLYNIKANCVGFKAVTVFEIEVTKAKVAFVNIEMEATINELSEAVVAPPPFVKKMESPVSLRSIGVAEIKRNPGANRDISKVIQSLPGVAVTASFRNDIIVRGGSPNENRFYLDGIEVPNINHFATQGASGGPVGLINVDFIESVDFYAGSFPANRGNALSSVLDFKLKEARRDKPLFTASVGATDLGLTVETPLTQKSTLIASWRRSYLQFLFQALELPFLPTYDDFMIKSETEIDSKNIIEFIGLGAYDRFELNTSANETDLQQYILNNIPSNNQWNYTVGTRYRHFGKNGFTTFVLSRNMLNNTAEKYVDNDNANEKILDYASTESENKLRVERTSENHGWKFNYGTNAELANYTTNTFQKLAKDVTLDYNSKINLFKYGLFAQVGKNIFSDKLALSGGIRMDANNFNDEMLNPLNQISPRISLSYAINSRLSLNANTGLYYQLPPYTVLGFRNDDNQLVNTKTTYISSTHYVAGIEYATSRNSRFSIEGFYKHYNNYPFDLIDSISLANEGSDFGVVGNTPVVSDNKGRAMGVEVLMQQKLHKNFYGLLSYTFMRSEFQDINRNYVAASWDYRHILSATAGYMFGKNWEAGLKLRYSSGNPYTPYDVELSMYKPNWDVTGQGIPDYTLLNTERIEQFYQLDIRVDKKYNFKKWSLGLYLDIQNLTNNKTSLQPYLSVERDANGNAITNPANSNYYLPKQIENTSGTIIPTLGIIATF